MKKFSNGWVFLSIIIIVAIPIIYNHLYEHFSYLTIKNAFVSAKIVKISPSYVSGTITKIYVKKGSKITKGQIIATIDDTLYKAAVEEKKSELNYITSEIKNLDNQTKSNIYSILKKERDLIEKELNLAKIMLSYTKITSPINGVVAENAATVGDTVSAGSVITYAYDPSTLYVKAFVPQDNLRYVKINKKVIIEIPETQKNLMGTIKTIGGLNINHRCDSTSLIPITVKIPLNSHLYIAEPVYVIIKR